MSITVVPSAVTGQTYSAANYNTQVRDNINGIWVLTTAGDLLYATGASAAARLAIGAQGSVLRSSGTAPAWLARGTAKGMVLSVNDAESDVEYRYAQIMYTCVYHNTTQTVPATPTALAVLFNSEHADALGWHSTSSNTNRIVPTVAGDYRASLFFGLNVGSGSSSNAIKASILLNNTTELGASRTTVLANFDHWVTVESRIVTMNGSTDYVNATIEQNNAGTLSIFSGAWFQLIKVK